MPTKLVAKHSTTLHSPFSTPFTGGQSSTSRKWERRSSTWTPRICTPPSTSATPKRSACCGPSSPSAMPSSASWHSWRQVSCDYPTFSYGTDLIFSSFSRVDRGPGQRWSRSLGTVAAVPAGWDLRQLSPSLGEHLCSAHIFVSGGETVEEINYIYLLF